MLAGVKVNALNIRMSPKHMCYVCSTDVMFLFHPDLNGNATKYIDFAMPTRALMLLDELITLYSERSVCSFQEVQNAAVGLGLSDNNGFIRCLLEMFSALGAVSWFPKVDHNLVVLKPQWLLDSLACPPVRISPAPAPLGVRGAGRRR